MFSAKRTVVYTLLMFACLLIINFYYDNPADTLKNVLASLVGAVIAGGTFHWIGRFKK